jgi:hypothetical protein
VPHPRPQENDAVADLTGILQRRLSGLFPEDPLPEDPPLPRAHRRRRVAGYTLAVVAGTLVSLARTPHVFDTTWAEDASLFLADALTRPARAFAIPYSGYFHLLPRSLAAIAALFPPRAAPAAIAISAALVTASLAAFAYAASRAHLRTPLARLLVSAPVLVFPVTDGDVANSINPLRWQLMYATCWALLWVPRGAAGRLLVPLVVGTAVASDNVVAIFLPLAAARVWTRRDRPGTVAAALLAGGTVLNALVPVLGIDEHRGITPRVSLVWAIEAYVLRPVPQALLGVRLVGLRPEHTLAGLAPVAAGWLLVAAAILAAFLLARRGVLGPNWTLAVVAGGYSAVLYVFVVMVSGFALDRYSLPAALLAITALTAILASPTDGRQGQDASLWARWRRPAAALVPSLALAGLLAVVCAANFRGPNPRSDGPRWRAELRRARAECLADPARSAADLAVSPTASGWVAHLPCGYLRR